MQFIFISSGKSIEYVTHHSKLDGSPSSSQTFNDHTGINARTKSIILLIFGERGDSSTIGPIVSCTYGGNTCIEITTQTKSTVSTRESRVSAYYLNNPPTGAQAVSLTWAGNHASAEQAYTMIELDKNIKTTFDIVSDTVGTTISLAPGVANNKRGIFAYAAVGDVGTVGAFTGTGVNALYTDNSFAAAYANNTGSSVTATITSAGTYPAGIGVSIGG